VYSEKCRTVVSTSYLILWGLNLALPQLVNPSKVCRQCNIRQNGVDGYNIPLNHITFCVSYIWFVWGLTVFPPHHYYTGCIGQWWTINVPAIRRRHFICYWYFTTYRVYNRRDVFLNIVWLPVTHSYFSSHSNVKQRYIPTETCSVHSTVLCRMTFWSATDCIYSGGPIRYYSVIL
jgi:hypothetical protein